MTMKKKMEKWKKSKFFALNDFDMSLDLQIIDFPNKCMLASKK